MPVVTLASSKRAPGQCHRSNPVKARRFTNDNPPPPALHQPHDRYSYQQLNENRNPPVVLPRPQPFIYVMWGLFLYALMCVRACLILYSGSRGNTELSKLGNV